VPDLAWTSDEDGVVMRFSLPSGSYATVLLSELLGPDISPACEEMPDEDGA